MVEVYTVKADGIERQYTCGSPTVASKKFLNYLRLYRKERPTRLAIINESGERFEAEAEWYHGKLEESSFRGAEGEWWKLLKVSSLRRAT